MRLYGGIREWVNLIKREDATVKERQVIKWLLMNKILYRNSKGDLRAYAEHDDYFKLVAILDPNMNERHNLKIKGKGILFFSPKIIEVYGA
jgi:phage antirepressor YoqD-like protein